MILTRTKQIGPLQNNWYFTKMIWTVQNHFGPIEGQGITVMYIFRTNKMDFLQIINLYE